MCCRDNSMDGEHIFACEKDPDGSVDLALSGSLLGKVKFCHSYLYAS